MEKHRAKLTKGFTLIELLVVIAIIALLLSILMPALSKVKEKAKLIVCLSNLGQAGKGVYTYATEFDGFLPPMHRKENGEIVITTSIGNQVGNWEYGTSFGLLVPEPYGWSSTGYLPDADSLVCPMHGKGYHLQGNDYIREKKHFFRPDTSAGPKGGSMSYIYVYATPFSDSYYTDVWKRSFRYRLEKTEGTAVILLEQGYWGENVSWNFYFNPPFHKDGMNTLHLNGRANFAKGKLINELYEEEMIINPTPLNVYWENFFRVVDEM